MYEIDKHLNNWEKMTVLVVEDDFTSRLLIQRLLQKQKYKVLEAENGILALRVLSKESVDLIITDITMPEMHGLDFLKKLKSEPRFAKIPVIMCTGVSDQTEVQKALRLGIAAYVLKPINGKILLRKTENALERIKPVLKDPHYTAHELGMDLAGLQEILRAVVDNTKTKLKEIGGSVEVGDFEPFRIFLRDLSASAETFDAQSLLHAAKEASRVKPEDEKSKYKKYFFYLRSEIERLHLVVENLK